MADGESSGKAPNPAEAAGQGSVEERLQEFMAYGEQLRAELGALEEQRQMMSEVLMDYTRGREALKALAESAGDEEVLVPMGGGNYVPAKLVNGKKVLTAIGASVHVESDVADAIKRLESREEQAKQATEQLRKQSEELTQEMTRVNRELQSLYASGAGEQG